MRKGGFESMTFAQVFQLFGEWDSHTTICYAFIGDDTMYTDNCMELLRSYPSCEVLYFDSYFVYLRRE